MNSPPTMKTIAVVGGLADGTRISRPTSEKTTIRVAGAKAEYTVRRLRSWELKLVEVMAPVGERIDPFYLAANGLTVE